MENKWKRQWKNIVGACAVAITLVLGITVVSKSAISELAGLAVAQTNTLWNSVADAAKGDGLTSGVMAQSTYLWNGISFDRLKSGATADGQAVTGILANTPLVLNTAGTYDRIRGGLTADGNAGTGLLNNAAVGLNTAGTFDRIKAGLTADGVAGTGLLNPGMYVFNASTWDRLRTASGDALAVTGMTAVGNMLWNGASNDRWRSASATNNTATTSLGGAQVTQLSTWSITNTQTGAAQATVSKAAGGGTVRHVATGVTICGGDTVVAAPRQINLRDGATGAGTIIRSWWIGISVINDTKCIDLAPINMTGTANTAMTIEFAGAGSATSSSTVTLTGYSTP